MNPDKKAAAKNFSQAASTYNTGASAQAQSADKLARLIKRYLEKDRSIAPVEKMADLGCGTGMLSRHLVEMFPQAELTVVDIAPDMLTQCEENLDGGAPFRLTASAKRKIRYLQADVETEAWGTGFSLITSNYCLQWTDPAASLKNLVPRLRSDGLFAFAVPCRGTFPELHAALREVRQVNAQGLKYHSAEAWTKMLRTAGLKVVKHDTFNTVLSFANSASALRSFSTIGASFSRHADYQPLDRRQIVKLLRIYDKKSETSEAYPYSRVTYKTLMMLCRLN